MDDLPTSKGFQKQATSGDQASPGSKYILRSEIWAKRELFGSMRDHRIF